MAYERIFEKPYEDGYEDLPLETTPVTAQTLNDKDDALEHIEDYLETLIEANPTLQGGESNLTALAVEGTIYKIAGGGGGTAEDITYDNTETGMTADNVQDAIDEVFQYGNNRKSQLVDKIVAKGGESSTSESWDNVIEDIDTIPSGGGSDITTRVLVGNTVTGAGSGSASGNTNIDDATEIILRLWLWCPDISVAGNVSVTINNTDTYQLTEYTHYEYEDAYHSIRTYRMTIPSTDVTRIGYSFSGLSYNQGSQFHGEISLKHAGGGGGGSHLTPLFISESREGYATYKTKVGAGKYICILVSGSLSAMTPTGLNSSGTEIFSHTIQLPNSRYCFVKEFELDEDGWIQCEGGYQNGQYLTSRRYIFNVDFDLNENISEAIGYENNYPATHTVTTAESKIFACVLNTVDSVVTDISSTQEITENHNFGNCSFAYDENSGESYTLSATQVSETWSTNVYLAFSIV